MAGVKPALATMAEAASTCSLAKLGPLVPPYTSEACASQSSRRQSGHWRCTYTEDDVGVLVTGGLDDGSETLLGDTEESMVVRGGAHAVGGDLEGTVGTVLEA